MADHIVNLSTVPLEQLQHTHRVLTDVGISTLPHLLMELYSDVGCEIEDRLDKVRDVFHVLSDLCIRPPQALIDLYAGHLVARGVTRKPSRH